jgi:hypothetical protein
MRARHVHRRRRLDLLDADHVERVRSVLAVRVVRDEKADGRMFPRRRSWRPRVAERWSGPYMQDVHQHQVHTDARDKTRARRPRSSGGGPRMCTRRVPGP